MRCFVFLSFILATTLAAEEVKPESTRNERQTGWYAPLFTNSYDDYPNQDGIFQLRSLPIRRPVSANLNNALQFDDTEPRQGFGLLNNVFANSRPAMALLSNLPVIRNPNFPTLQNVLTSFDSCTATSGESGICTPGFACSAYGGRSSGSCSLGRVCCVNVVSGCDRQITLNSTYWETPRTTVTRPTTCSLTVKIDQRLLEQKTPICQVRLDFNSFTIGPPETTTVCSTDTFRVSGASSTVPDICGENPGQHMYIDVPNSATTSTNLNLAFSFGPAGTVAPAWNIKISLLPCGASYLAPSNCLQYFTSNFGTVQSFNYKDETRARQLANQNYRICFKSEAVKSVCLTACTTNTASTSFSLTGSAAAGVALASQALRTPCSTDYVIFPGGYKPGSKTSVLDRFCGTAFSTDGGVATSTQVCSDVKPFGLVYVTSSDETTGANTDAGNIGFCFNYQQIV